MEKEQPKHNPVKSIIVAAFLYLIGISLLMSDISTEGFWTIVKEVAAYLIIFLAMGLSVAMFWRLAKNIGQKRD